MSRDERSFEAGSDARRCRRRRAGALKLLGLLPTRRTTRSSSAPRHPTAARPGRVQAPPRREPAWDFPEGSLGRREVAAYLVASALGWPNVPPTVLREGPEGLRSVQLFVPFEPQEHYFTLQDRFPDAFREIAASTSS